MATDDIDIEALGSAIESASENAQHWADYGGTDDEESRAAHLADVALWDNHGARIVDCVKACAGIADPAEAIEKARDSLKTARGILATAGANGHKGASEAAAMMMESLAALNPKPKE